VPTLTLTIEVPFPKGKVSFSRLERDVHRAAMAAGLKGPGPGARSLEFTDRLEAFYDRILRGT